MNNQGYALIESDNAQTPLMQRIALQNKPLPSLKKGEVLVKILATPVNPSDLVYLKGKYGVPPAYGAFAGFEACGEVVAANAGLYGKWLVGKRVAMFASPGLDGVWAQFAVTKANFCIVADKQLSDAQVATLVVNPFTAVCLVERAIALNSKAVVLNAAASQVGKGVIRYCKAKGIKTIATVRSQKNVTILNQLGADHVLLTTEDDFKQKLKQLSHQCDAKVLLDAVADKDTSLLLGSMPKNSTAIVYGRLSETHEPLGGYFSVADVIFKGTNIEGFWLATFVKEASLLTMFLLTRKVQKLFVDGVFDTDIYGEFDFSSFPEALAHYATHKSDGKVLLCPWLDKG